MDDFIAEAIEGASLEFSCEERKDGGYLCTISSERGSMVREIRLRPEVDGLPKIGQLLFFYADRIQLVHDADDFAQWAEDCGLDVDDPTAREEYRVLIQDADELAGVMGQDCFETMMAGLEICQAICRARPQIILFE